LKNSGEALAEPYAREVNLLNSLYETKKLPKACPGCDSIHEVIIIDGCFKRGNILCSRIGCEIVESETTGLTYFSNCSKRPFRGQQYCTQHLLENMNCLKHQNHRSCKIEQKLIDVRSLVAREEILVEYKTEGGSWVKDTSVCVKEVVAFETSKITNAYVRVRDLDESETSFCPNLCLNKSKRRLKRSCGISVATYPCGYILNVMPMLTSENLKHICIQLSDVQKQTTFKYVGYDFSCGLGKFVHNLESKNIEHEEGLKQLKRLKFVVDRFHQKTHKCHQDEQSPYRWDSYPPLIGVNSQQCEQLFKQFKKLYSSLSSCCVRTCTLMYLIIQFHRNLQMENQQLSFQLEKNYSKLKRKRNN
jgi:hypothetical protein